jgi:hypothetical protein
VIQPTEEAILCPEECRCDEDEYFVNCSDSALNSIPPALPTPTTQLVLDGKSITYFENYTFVSRELLMLQIIRADFCKIRKIELGAFNGLKWLRIISVRGNEITEIIPGKFEKSSHVKNPVLRKNRIEHLESDLFRGLAD